METSEYESRPEGDDNQREIDAEMTRSGERLRRDAEQHREVEEIFRREAEQERAAREMERRFKEDERESAEAAREAAEEARYAAELARKATEEARAIAEASRVEAEITRQTLQKLVVAVDELARAFDAFRGAHPRSGRG